MKRAIFIIIEIIIAIVVFGLAVFYIPKIFNQGDISDFVPENNETKNILVRNPLENSSETLSFAIEGEARVFENMFAYRIKDAADNYVLIDGNGYANAADVGEFGPFAITVTALRRLPVDEDVILEVFDYSAKDGSEENKVVIPFKLRVDRPEVLKVFFGKQGVSEMDCKTMTAIDRIVVRTSSPARAVLELLLQGPTREEVKEGYYTSLNPGIKIQKLTIENATATADFDETLDKNMGGSCRVAAIRSQIVQTLKQFPTIKNVIIAISGRTEDILQP
jgi:hypothetical protein